MKKIILATLFGFGLLATPAVTNAAPVDQPMVLAQFFPGGQGFERERERVPERRFEERGGRFERERERRREFRRRQHCEIVIVRKRTPFGIREERVRRCR